MSSNHPSHSRWDQPQLWSQGGYSHVQLRLSINLDRGAETSEMWIAMYESTSGELITAESLPPIEWGKESTILRAIAHSTVARARLLLEPF